MADESQVAAQVQQPEVTPVEPVTSPTDAVTAPVTEQQPQKPEKTFTQAELDDILEKRLAKERRKREDIRREADVFRRLALERGESRPTQQSQEPQPQARPKLEDFGGDWEKYTDALVDFRADKVVSDRIQKYQRENTERQQAEHARSMVDTYATREAKAIEKYEDYEEIAKDPSLPITRVMADTIMLSDIGTDIAYYLGRNHDEAARIARMPPLLAAVELGKISTKLAAAPMAPKKTVTKAPDPISPVGGKASPITNSDEPLDTDDIDTWRRKREAQIRKRMTGK